MKVLDLFSGLGGWSQAFKNRNHQVVTVDNNPKCNPSICQDVRELSADMLTDVFGSFDIILASPPCNCFSVASIGKHWFGRTPDRETQKAINLVGHTVRLILNLFPKWWILENPRGMLRKVLGKPSVTTFFASWGEFNYKPTDLWGVIPEGIEWRKPRKWQKASRGDKTGTQMLKTAEQRAKIPYELSLAVCLACEKVLGVEGELNK